ncbi:MAG: Zn-ribbon domain-containing OB-fold protein [Acidimicrobiales bacterium]
MSDAPLPPMPVPDADTQAFWDAAAEHCLVIPRCERCGAWIWQPKPVCPRCQTAGPVWTQVAGDGRVASWTVLHPPVLPAYADLLPFVILLVELTEGVRLVGQLVDEGGRLLRTDGSAEGVAMGSPVSLRWRESAGAELAVWSLD